jgi:hypothetical protein
MAGEGNRGSTSGLRFNPREAPEFIEQDRTHANGDPREQEKSEQKEIKERKDRQKKLAGLRHIKVKIDQKEPKEDKFDSQAQVGQQAAQTGPPGMSAAFPPGGGLDAPIQTGEAMSIAWDTFKKTSAAARGTETLESVSARERGKAGARTKKRGTTTETLRFGAKGMGEGKKRKASMGNMNIFTRHPDTYSATVSPGRQLLAQGDSKSKRLTGTRFRGLGPSGPRVATPDPRRRFAAAARSGVRRELPLTDIPPPLPFQTGDPPKGIEGRGEERKKKNTALEGPKKIAPPKQPKTPLGKKNAPKMPGVPTIKGNSLRSLASSVVGGLKSSKGFSAHDMAEIRALLNRLRSITKSDDFQKSFYNQKGDAEGPSPNAHPRQTSHPTGGTEADPDDDPTMWGAHPIGLLAPRRGHQ